MEVNRIFNPNCCVGKLGSINEIDYSITQSDYIMDQNIALVLDTSASMEHVWLNEKEKRIDVLADCVETLLDSFNKQGSEVRIFGCSENCKYLDIDTACSCSNTGDFISQMFQLNAGGNTNLGDGMREAYWYLKNSPTASKKYMIILSDGETNSYTTTGNTAQSDFKLDAGDAVYTFKGTRALEYAQKIGGMIAGQGITTFAVALTANTPNQLEAIATACNALPLDNGKNYYQIRFADEIQAIYAKMMSSLPSSIPITIAFDEVFPYGVEVQSVPDGLKISKQMDSRYCVKGTLNGSFVKNDSTGIYSLKTWTRAIKVKYTSPGVKQFLGPSVSFIHPSGKMIIAILDNLLIYSVFV